MTHTDLAIVGGGIVGLAHAVHAARAGLSVAVFERNARADGASIQNFGMLALVAQSAGEELERAERALATWQDTAAQAGIEMTASGCLFLARVPEEMSVLEEFAGLASLSGREADLLAPSELNRYATNVRTENMVGGLWSPEAWKVDQRQATSKIADWLRREYNVSFHFGAEVRTVSPPQLETSIGSFKANHVILCGGDEFAILFPDDFKATGVARCQLQMLRTHPQPAGWRLQPFVAGGLSLPRFDAFAPCPSLPELRAYQQRHYSDHLSHGVHVIACQEFDGSITIGDSHAYGDKSGLERSEAIDQLILDDLAGMITLPNPQIAERWLGRYAYLPGTKSLQFSPMAGVTAVTVTNGQGMTHAFAIAEDVVAMLVN